VRADYVIVAAKSDPSKGHKGLSMFIVDKGTPGFTVSKKLQEARLALIGHGRAALRRLPRSR